MTIQQAHWIAVQAELKREEMELSMHPGHDDYNEFLERQAPHVYVFLNLKSGKAVN